MLQECYTIIAIIARLLYNYCNYCKSVIQLLQLLQDCYTIIAIIARVLYKIAKLQTRIGVGVGVEIYNN